MKQCLLKAIFAIFCSISWAASTPAWAEMSLEQAQRYYEEKSYRLAIDAYKEYFTHNPDQLDMREIRFKMADAAWRTGEPERYKNAVKDLQSLIDDDSMDDWTAKASDSLAQHYIQHNVWQNRDKVVSLLNAARSYWAKAKKSNQSRQEFIDVSFTLANVIQTQFGWHHQIKPLKTSNILSQSALHIDNLYDEILSVAVTEADKSKAAYFKAYAFYQRQRHQVDKMPSIHQYFQAIIDDYSESEWVDDAYYHLGEGYYYLREYVKALDIYKEFADTFNQGESRWLDDAQRRITEIITPELSFQVPHHYLPGSEINFNLRWRNLSRVKVDVYPIDLIDQLQFDLNTQMNQSHYGVTHYHDIIDRFIKKHHNQKPEAWLSTTIELKNDNEYQHHQKSVSFSEWLLKVNKDKASSLPVGAYVFILTSDSVKAYDLMLVTDLAMVTKMGSSNGAIYAFHSQTGQPEAEAMIKFHYRYQDKQGRWKWHKGQGYTDSQGLLKFSLPRGGGNQYSQSQIFAVASASDRSAFSQSYFYGYSQKQSWSLYAQSDRPAYRPNETVGFKATLREKRQSQFFTPSQQKIRAFILNPQGEKIYEKDHVLNDFGSFSDSMVLDDKAKLGKYQIKIEAYSDNERTHYIGTSRLFSLEEYKLPEFKVDLKTPLIEGQNGFQLGDQVPVEISAEYYFGGAVSGADVEYLIYRSPYYHFYQPHRPYPWYYQHNISPPYGHFSQRSLITTAKINTDSEGRAKIFIPTDKDFKNDLLFDIEVRVVDASRREVVAQKQIKVTRFPYFVYLQPKANIYRPGDHVMVDIKTLTVNDDPVSVDGVITVNRHWWKSQDEKLSESDSTGHELFKKFIRTNDQGQTVFKFEPDQIGYYEISFTGYTSSGEEITSQGHIFVADKNTRDIGFRYGGIQMITEKDTYQEGETARLMLVSDQPQSWVLLSLGSDDLFGSSVHHLQGAVKLIEVPVTKQMAPNVFIDALLPRQQRLYQDQIEWIVPPNNQFLNVEVRMDQDEYQPQDKGVIDIYVTDHNAKPVSAEIAIGLVDDSVYYIQSDQTKDIREFFYGAKKLLSVQTNSSYEQKSYYYFDQSEDNNNDDESSIIQTKHDLKNKRHNHIMSQSLLEGSMDSAVGRSKPAARRAFAKGSAIKKENRQMFADQEMANVSVSEPAALVEPVLRRDFRSTIVWLPDVITDQAGRAQVKVTFPDSLTTWRTTARAITRGTQVGNTKHYVKTNKTVMVRLQAPRFFTERDAVTISANVHNESDKEDRFKVTLKAKGLNITSETTQWVTLAAHSQARVDWQVTAEKSGQAQLTVMAEGASEADAMQRSYPVIPHGINMWLANTVSLKDSDEKNFIVRLPEKRINSSTSMTMQLSPSMVLTMLDALPYLADFPYGCVEQTMSRFVPALVVKKTMRELGLTDQNIDQYMKYVFHKRQDPKHPERNNQSSLSALDDMVEVGLQRIYDFQHSNGGWGWWKKGRADRFMSAYVVWGLHLAQSAGVAVDRNVIERGRQFLMMQLVEEEKSTDMLAWMLHAISVGSKNVSQFESKYLEYLWQERQNLNPYTRALFALILHQHGDTKRAQVVARNLINGIKNNIENGTAHWGQSGVHYRWSEGGVEATAIAIKALANILPESEWLEPAVKWLVLNRRGGRWKSTRDTAMVIYGLSDYLKTTDELNPDLAFEIFLNNKLIRKGHLTREDLFTFDRHLMLDSEQLLSGENHIVVKTKGFGALYVAGFTEFFTLEENIPAADHEISVSRKYYIESNEETLLNGYKKTWKELNNGDAVESGQRVKVEITFVARNHYEYLIAEDWKPAGFEFSEKNSGSTMAQAIDASGQFLGAQTWVYQELRDQKAVFFIDKMTEGQHQISYTLRAEIPGAFHAMPNQTHAMYVPEIRANSQEMQLTVIDQ